MPNQVTRARRRRLDNLSRLETDLAESPGALAALAETLERGVPKRSHRGSGSHKKPSKDLWRTKLCSAFEATGACPDGAQCTFAHGAAQLRRRSAGVCSRVSDDAAAVGPTRWTVHAGEQSGWGAGGAPPSPPALARVDSSDLSTALERVRSITIDEAELTLSPHARAFSMPEPAPAVTPDGSPRLAGFHRSRPPSPPPFSLAPPAKAARTRGDGRLVGTVVHLSRKLCGTFDTVDEDGVAVTRFNGWYGFVRPDESTLRDEGFCRGDLFLHPSDAPAACAPAHRQPLFFAPTPPAQVQPPGRRPRLLPPRRPRPAPQGRGPPPRLRRLRRGRLGDGVAVPPGLLGLAGRLAAPRAVPLLGRGELAAPRAVPVLGHGQPPVLRVAMPGFEESAQ